MIPTREELLVLAQRCEMESLERENAALRERLAAAEDLLVGVMDEGVEYQSAKYALVQMSHELRDDIRKFNAARAEAQKEE